MVWTVDGWSAVDCLFFADQLLDAKVWAVVVKLGVSRLRDAAGR